MLFPRTYNVLENSFNLASIVSKGISERKKVLRSMSKNFHETFGGEEIPLPSERSTGLVFAAVALIVAVFWRSDGTVLLVSGICAGAFLVVSLLIPKILRPLNVAWFGLGLILNRIVSPVVMFILFAIVIVPFGLVMQLVYDPLRKQLSEDHETLWMDKKAEDAPGSMLNQF